MANIKVDSSKITEASGDYKRSKTQIDNLISRLNKVYINLDKDIKAKNGLGKTFSNIINDLNNINKQVNGAANFLVITATDVTKAEMENTTLISEKQNQNWVKAVPTAAGAAIAASNASKKITIGSVDQRQKQDWVKAEPTGKLAAQSGTIGSAIGSAIPVAKDSSLINSALNKANGLVDSALNKATTKIEELKKTAPDKLMSEAKSMGVGVVGFALGKGIQELSKAGGITGGSAEATAVYSSSGLSSSSSSSGNGWIANSSATLGSVNAGATASAVFDPAKGNIGANVAAGFNATGAKVTAAVIGEYGSASATAAAGVVDVSAKADATLMKNGSFIPSAAVGVAARIVALEATAAAKAGNENLNVGATATGSVGSVSGAASAEFDPQKGNINVGVNGMVAAAKGAVRADTDLGIAKVGVTATGYAGAIGAEANIGFKDGKFSADIGAALGVGGKVSFDVDVGSGIKNLDKYTGGAVSGAVGVLNDGLKVVGSAVGTVVDSGKAIVSGAKDFGSSVAKGDISGAATAVVKTTENVIKSVGTGVVTAAKAVGGGIATAAKTVGKFVSSIFSGW